MATIAGLYRYPVKGLSPEALEQVTVAAGEALPFDRAYAIENGPSPFDPKTPLTIKKAFFLMLMKNERLAALKTRFHEQDRHLTIADRHEAVLAEGRLDTAEGRSAVEAYFNRAFADELRGPARVLSALGHSFSDTAAKVVSLINLATVREIEAVVGVPVNPLRFRGNLTVEGLEAWAEMAWIGKTIHAGGVTLTGHARIDRCAATNVDPDTGARDLRIPDSLRAAYGHIDCGIYLKVATGGTMAVGDPIARA